MLYFFEIADVGMLNFCIFILFFGFDCYALFFSYGVNFFIISVFRLAFFFVFLVLISLFHVGFVCVWIVAKLEVKNALED